MKSNSKEVFIKLQHITEIVEILEQIKSSHDRLKEMFSKVDSLRIEEEKVIEQWVNHLEDINEKMEYLAL